MSWEAIYPFAETFKFFIFSFLCLVGHALSLGTALQLKKGLVFFPMLRPEQA